MMRRAILADTDYTNWIKRVSEGFSPQESVVLWIAVTALLLALLGYLFGRRLYLRMAARFRMQKLFRTLAEVHTLDDTERDLLIRIAHAANLRNPSILFLRPSLAHQYYAKLFELERADLTREGAPRTMESLSEKLWGE